MNYSIPSHSRDYFDWLVERWVKIKGYKIYILLEKDGTLFPALKNTGPTLFVIKPRTRHYSYEENIAFIQKILNSSTNKKEIAKQILKELAINFEEGYVKGFKDRYSKVAISMNPYEDGYDCIKRQIEFGLIENK